MAHSLLSPSAAHRWMVCPGSVAMEQDREDTTSPHAAWGTGCHGLAALVLDKNADPQAMIGTPIEGVTVDEDMADMAASYAATIRDYAQGGTLLVEQQVDFGGLIGQPDQKGTADAIVFSAGIMQLHDLKTGYNPVPAKDNKQLKLYALGAWHQFASLTGERIEQVLLVIHQPRLSSTPDEWAMSLKELLEFGDEAREAAQNAMLARERQNELVFRVWREEYLNPTESACKFCKAKADCPALRDFCTALVLDDFVDLDAPAAEAKFSAAIDRLRHTNNRMLGNLLPHLNLIEDWCKAVREKAALELAQGHSVPGWKLVSGRRGARAWADIALAEKSLSEALGDGAYKRSLITPAQAEKALKKAKADFDLAAMVTQPEGKPALVPESDKRPELAGVSAGFENLDNVVDF
jgi:hypothetical protein